MVPGPRRPVLYDPVVSDGDDLFACQTELLGLMETLINVIFCAKDLEGRYLAVNAAFVRRTGRKSKREVIGATARDFFRPELAERYEEQDREVYRAGAPLRDQLELIRRTNGELGWYLTTKLPVRDRGEHAPVVGLVSVSRDLITPSEESIAMERLQAVVEWVRQNLAESIRVADLARVAACSESQLERRMNRVFGQSATQWLLRVRVDTAARLLVETDDGIADIAGRCGFYDQPDFTRRFARLTNTTPARFRALNRVVPMQSRPRSV